MKKVAIKSSLAKKQYRSLLPYPALFVVCFIFAFMPAKAQRTASDTKKSDSTLNKILLPDSVIERKLVELALNGPTLKGAGHQNKINEYQLKAAKNSWLNLLSISATYNDRSFAKSTDLSATSYVYPKFFTGVTIPLGTIFSRTSVKAAKEQVEISKNSEEQLVRVIKADVLAKYKQYTTTGALILNQQQVVDDYQAAFLESEKKYSDKQITTDVYNNSSKNYNDEAARLLNLQLQQYQIKLDIEIIIGTTLESVLYGQLPGQ